MCVTTLRLVLYVSLEDGIRSFGLPVVMGIEKAVFIVYYCEYWEFRACGTWKMRVREKSLNKCVYSCSPVSEWKNVCATVVEVVVGIQSLQILWLGKLCYPSIAYCPFKGTRTCRKNIYS